MKQSTNKSLIFLLCILFTSAFAIAAEEGTDDVEIFSDAELTNDAGLTPDSAFYFLDGLFDGFSDDIDNREEKIAEIKELIEEGNTQDAKIALLKYKEFASATERDVTPQEQERLRRSAVAIKKVVEGLEQDLSQSDREEFIDDVLSQEDKIAASAKIAHKIKELCETLSTVDPVQYAQICKTDANAPQWQRDLDEKLSAEQEEEARKFFSIMSECFRDPAACRCDEISVEAFADKCSIVAPLAAKCEQGDKDACEQADAGTEDIADLLPPHLQEVMEELESEFNDAEFENHMPMECIDAGIDPKSDSAREECTTIMFKLNAPQECVEGLEQGKIDLSNERTARDECEKISFDANAPAECIDAGIMNHRECGKYMFEINAPQECIDAGLTGEKPSDPKKCEEISFKTNAPEECIEAGAKNHRECGKIMFPKECADAGLTPTPRDQKKCEEIMFKENAPEECVAAGITNGRECGQYVFQQNAPQECVDAGYDGKTPTDPRKCEELMRGKQGPSQGVVGEGPGKFSGPNCKEITDPTEKLTCLENFYNNIQKGGMQPGAPGSQPAQGEFGPEDTRYYNPQNGPNGPNGHQGNYPGPANGRDMKTFPPECQKAGITTPEECGKYIREQQLNQPTDGYQPIDGENKFPGNQPPMPPSGWKNGPNGQPGEWNGPKPEWDTRNMPPPNQPPFEPRTDGWQPPPPQDSGSTNSQPPQDGSSGSGSSTSEEKTSTAENSITGAVTADSRFLRYYWKW